ncbi:MAG TPA: esterase family protein, partial [Vicinamibacteria bacterium]|nr:esterase family protein [Vicinamibacteria bacterium]
MRALSGALLAALAVSPALRATDDYTLGPDSNRQAGVPPGRVEGPFVWKSPAIFPGTLRQYWIYAPAQYDAARPAAVMVFQDGHKYVNVEQEYRVPIVFDNLIHKGEMPATIGIFVNPGQRGESLP